VVSLALQRKVLPYAMLAAELGVQDAGVRALEDFLIKECFYAGILQGKLDPKLGCLQVCLALLHGGHPALSDWRIPVDI
jgi:hypothetical protein